MVIGDRDMQCDIEQRDRDILATSSFVFHEQQLMKYQYYWVNSMMTYERLSSFIQVLENYSSLFSYRIKSCFVHNIGTEILLLAKRMHQVQDSLWKDIEAMYQWNQGVEKLKVFNSLIHSIIDFRMILSGETISTFPEGKSLARITEKNKHRLYLPLVSDIESVREYFLPKEESQEEQIDFF
ncbi:MAG: hypothetical protein U9Q15_01235 [Patescibacteria group bacterium]|nr:hypothetical protein [Patescibacteria group bacterium]